LRGIPELLEKRPTPAARLNLGLALWNRESRRARQKLEASTAVWFSAHSLAMMATEREDYQQALGYHGAGRGGSTPELFTTLA
jgi:hypothetical protein